jgi:integrase
MHSILNGMESGAIMDDGLVDAARRVLFACVGVRKQEHPDLRQLGEFLHRYSLTQVSGSGEVGRCGAEDQPVFEYAPTRFRRRRNGVGPYVLHDSYQDAILRAGGLARARIDLELFHNAVPKSWVPIVAALIADGPDTAAARAHAAIFDYSKESVAANRRRTAGTRSRASVQIVLSEARRLFSTIHNLRTLPACRQWVQAPQLQMPDMPKGGYEVVAPRVETVRQAWQDKSSEIHERLGIHAIEEEMAALNSLSDNAVCSRGLWRPTRDRAVLLLMVLTGGRRTALARLTRKDYVRDCEGPLPDCRRGAALDLLPRKSKGRDELRRKPIPAQAALVLDFYIAVMDRMAAAKGRPPASPDAPLLVAEPAQLKAVQEQWLYRRVAGSRKYRPLVPRDPRHMAEHVTNAEDAICGYTPHEYRHFANKMAERAGEIWNESHPATGGETNPPIPYYAAALLDNGSIENDLRALYGDRRTPAMLEVVSGRAAEIGWEILTTDAGLRKRPDCQAYEREMIRLRRIEEEERRLERDAQTLQARHVSCGQQALLPPSPAESDRVDRIMHRQDEMVASIDELKEIMLQSSAITHQLIQLSRQKADTIVKLDLYRLDQATWLPVSDSEPPGAERVDWDAIDRGALGRPLMPSDTPTALRDWLTFPEFCEVAGLEARSTLTRWVNGEHIPARRDKRPWEPEQVPVDVSLGKNYRRIWVPGVHEAFWRTSIMRDKLAEILGRWPREQGWTTKEGEPTPRCVEPIRVAPARLQLVAA